MGTVRWLATLALLAAASSAWAGTVPHLSSADLLQLASAEPEKAFTLWCRQNGKQYAEGSKERSHRRDVFLSNVQLINEAHQRDPGVTLALNEFADMTWEEFSRGRLGLTVTEEQRKARSARAAQASSSFRYGSVRNEELPQQQDWRAKGAVAEVKNQGQCGSCWAFSTTGAVEGINAIVTGQLVSLSEQQLVDCDTEVNQGCGGGLMNDAFEYIIKNGGIDTDEDYAYWSGYGFSFWCNKRKANDRTAVSIDGYEEVPADEASLQKAVAHQPVAVGICAGASMMFYSSGIISTCCEGLNHGVLAVGYGTDEKTGTPYWIVKNSWGGGWGEQGYFRLKMGEGPTGLCEIASVASYPVKTSPNKPIPLICDMFGWTECSVGSSCSCSFSLFGFLCLWHDCCPLEGGVTCSDLKHCCPHGTTCDVRQGACVSGDGTNSVPWTDKTKATFVSAKDIKDINEDDEDVDDEEEQAFDAKFEIASGKEAAGSSVATMAVERQGQKKKKCSKQGRAGGMGGEAMRGMGGVMMGQQGVEEGQQAVEVEAVDEPKLALVSQGEAGVEQVAM